MKIINIDLAQNNKKNVPLIILNGSGGVGKDSFVNACANYVSLENYSTITYYKEIAKEKFNWDGIKDEKGRKLLSDLKRASIEYNNLPLKQFQKEYDEINDMHLVDMFICMCRDIDDIKKIKILYPHTITVLVTNKNVSDIHSNVGDDNVYNWYYDYIIANDGDLNDLNESAKTFLQEIGMKI